MNEVKTFYLVGNKFFRQLNDAGVGHAVLSMICIEKLLMSLKNNPRRETLYVIYLGQGIGYEEYQTLLTSIQQHGLNEVVRLESTASYQNPAHRLTNKHHPENILIADPIKISDQLFQSGLLIDECCQDMSDHLTGKHIAGMVITEAARQMVIAVTKKFFVPVDKKDHIGFVTHRTDCSFFQFLFPIPVSIEYEVKKIRQSDCNIRAEVEIRFYQRGELGATIVFEYSSLAKTYLQDKERGLAKKIMTEELSA
jgi:hypothetical protein